MSREKLKIAAIAHDVVWADKDENIITVAELLNKVERDTDIVVLPEMFSTGTIFNIEQIHEFAENENGIVIVNVCRWAQFFKFAICGSFLANVESGKKKPSVMTILRIAEALNVNPREFFPDSPTVNTKEDVKNQIINLLEKI